MKKNTMNAWFILGISILCFIFLIVSITSIAFLIGLTVSPIWFVVSLLLSVGIAYRLLSEATITKPILWIGLLLSAIVVSIGFASVTIDPSWDGNAYHKIAIGELKDGWNPVWHSGETFNKSSSNPLQIIGENGASDIGYDTIWTDHYPKATWIFSATIYKVTGTIESGKSLAPLVTIALFLITFGYLSKKVNNRRAALLGILLAFNPVMVAQIYSNYVDGIIGSLLIILIIACSMLADKKIQLAKNNTLLYTLIFMVIALVVNIKFTGIIYAGIIILCYLAYFFIARQKKTVLRLILTGSVSLLFGLLVIGASTYIKNFYTNGNPLYPLAGQGSIDVITSNEPPSYQNEPEFIRFIKANLAPTVQLTRDMAIQQGEPGIKFPFSITTNEISQLNLVDIRQGGYGVWFGGVLILTFIAGVYLLVTSRRYKKYIPIFLLPIIVLALSAIFVDGSWWARYLPHLAIVPVVVVLALYLRNKLVLANILIFAMLFNVALYASINTGSEIMYRKSVKQNFHTYLTCDSKQAVRVFSSDGRDGLLYNIKDYCRNIRVVSPQEFRATEQQDRIELIPNSGVYVIK